MDFATDLQVLRDGEAVARAAATEFGRLARMRTHARRDFRVALAGGATPRRTYELLAGATGEGLPWERVHLFQGDERHVPPGHADSNFRVLLESGLAGGRVPLDRVHRIHAEQASAASAASDYERVLKEQFALVGAELPRFDLLMLGMGADGHAASLFPGTSAVTVRDGLVTSAWVQRLQVQRITLTLPVMEAAARIVFLVEGGGKADMLRLVLQGASPERPASLVRAVRGRLTWLVDRAAARNRE